MDLSIFQGGSNRIDLSPLTYLLLFTLPSSLLTLLVIQPNISNRLKQIISIPLLIITFLTPFGFSTGNRLADFATNITTYNLFLRQFELYWVGPITQHKDVFITFDKLWIDFWGSMRTFPKPNSKGEIKIFKKDKKFYHILINLTINAVLIDILASWALTFTVEDILSLPSTNYLIYILYIVISTIILTMAFNAVGYAFQLFYCLAFENGSYSSEQWRTLMDYPLFSTSLTDLWSRRWHQLFKSTWLAAAFRPTRSLTLHLTGRKPLSLVLGALSVFFVSGLMHEYLVAANLGLDAYKTVWGQQTLFFMIHGIGCVLEGLLSPPRPVTHLTLIVVVLLTFPFIAQGFYTWGFIYDNILIFSRPYILHHAHPFLYSYFGSLK